MIPTMILVGLILSLVPRHWQHRAGAIAAVTAVGSLMFGFAVGEPIAGTVLAGVNAGVGVLFGLGVRSAGRDARRSPPNGASL